MQMRCFWMTRTFQYPGHAVARRLMLWAERQASRSIAVAGALSRPSDIGLRLDRAYLLDLVLQTLFDLLQLGVDSRRSGCFERFATAG